MGKKDIDKTITLKDRVSGVLKHINGGTVQYKKNLKDLEKTAGSAWKTVKVGVAAAAAAATGAAVGFGALVYKTADAADRIDKMSQRLGLSRQGFQELDYILGQNGVSIDSLGNGMKQFSQQLYGLQTGAKGSSDLFRQLGLDASVSAMSQEDAFKTVVAAFQEIEEGAAKAALAQKLFGRNGQEMLPMLNASKGSVEELTEQYNKLGAALSDKAIDNGVKFKDNLDTLKVSIKGAFQSLAAPALPIFNQGVQWLINKIPLARKFATDAFDSMRASIERNVEKFNQVKAAVDDLKERIFGAFSPDGEGGGAVAWMVDVGIPRFIDGTASVLEKATNVYNFISDNWAKFEPLIYGIVGGLVAYKAIMMGVTTWKYAAAAAQWAWNVAMNANPIGLIALGIGALIGVGILLIRNWDNVKLAGQKTWNGILAGAEWMANGVIKAINWMVASAVKPINKFIEGINKILGVAVKPIEFGISEVSFAAAKYDVADQEFDWRWKKEKEQKQERREDTLIKALEANTAAAQGNTRSLSENTTAVNKNTARLRDDLGPVDLADSLLNRIERHIWA